MEVVPSPHVDKTFRYQVLIRIAEAKILDNEGVVVQE
jgi:hypothetical protein